MKSSSNINNNNDDFDFDEEFAEEEMERSFFDSNISDRSKM